MRDPLGSTTRLMRTSIAALAVVAACTSEPRRDPATQHAGPVAQAPAAPAVPAPTALGSHWPLLDTIRRRLVAFDTQVTNTQHELRTRSATAGGDSLFLKFRNSYMAVAESLTERLGDDTTGQGLSISRDGWSDSLRSVLQRHGFDLNFSEGNAFVDEDVAYLLVAFEPLLTPAMREYLSIRNVEQHVRFSEDAALQISWDAVGDRIATWEAFLHKYPTFSWRHAAQYWRTMYLETYLTGMDNTRTFTDNGTLEQEVRRSYQHFLRTNAATPAAAVIRDYLALLEANPAPSDSTIKRFLREHELQSMLGVQPPVN